MLAFLLILAPLAFLFYILPATATHWKKWWSVFLSHAFFLPVFLFLLYLTIAFLASLSSGHPEGYLLGDSALIFIYVIAVVMLLTSLIIGKTMGVMGANAALKWATAGRKFLTGYAGMIGKRYAGRAAEAISKRMEKKEEEIGRIAKYAKQVPFVQRGFAKAAGMRKKEVAKFEKQYGSYTTATLKDLQQKLGTPGEARDAMGKIIKKREDEDKKKDEKKKEKQERQKERAEEQKEQAARVNELAGEQKKLGEAIKKQAAAQNKSDEAYLKSTMEKYEADDKLKTINTEIGTIKAKIQTIGPRITASKTRMDNIRTKEAEARAEEAEEETSRAKETEMKAKVEAEEAETATKKAKTETEEERAKREEAPKPPEEES